MQLRLKSLSSLAALLALLSIAATAGHAAESVKQAAQKTTAKAPPNPALAPIQDVASLPRVLLVGDTVSTGYTLQTRKLLEGKANVHRIPRNGASSKIGAEQITEWVGAGPWDLIHFNFGAFDLMPGKDGKAVVSPELYESYFRLIVRKLRVQAPTARLVFATTTPMPAENRPGSPFQYDLKNADAYAAIAAKVMKATGVRVNDLHAAIQPRAAELRVPGTINFKPAGFELIAQEVAREIETTLKEPAPVPEKAASTQKGLRVFTCGHSFHVWIVPLLSEMALGAGIVDHVIAGKSSIGGSTVLKHWEVPDDKNIAKRVLSEGQADVLTLSPIWLPDAGIENFAKLAVEHNPNIRITVQEYWLPNDEYHPVYPLDTRKKVDHNATTIPVLQKAQDDYDRDVDEHVREINTMLGTKTLVTVPVGQAVVKLREKILAGECPGIKEQSELFRDNWGHPTQPIMALAGYCHFAVIYQRSPVGLPRPAVLTRNPAWDDRLNRLLQELAWDAVLKHPMSGVQGKPEASAETDAKRSKGKRSSRHGKVTDAASRTESITDSFPDFKYAPDIVYKQVGDQALQMDLLTPKGLNTASAPVLIYIHGGGWGGGDRYRMQKPDIAGVFTRCGKAGITCASIEYRLNSEKVTAFDSAVDCKDALRFLVKNATRYHIDPARMGTIGGSAGGHLSLVTALGDPKDFPGDPALVGHDPVSIRCEVAYYPATDFTDSSLAGRFLGGRAERMFGGPVAEKAEVIRLLSPVALIRKGSTPVYCFHGDKDTTLSVENSQRLYAKGKAVGADIQYTEVKNGSHGFGAGCTPTIDEITALAAQFLIERLTR